MDLSGKRIVVTGAAGGIGLAMAKAALERGAEHAVLVDLDEERLAQAAAGIGDRASAVAGDDADAALLKRAFDAAGQVDAFFANAGIGTGAGLGERDDWAATMRVNIEAHVTAAQLLIPRWLERGAGLWVTTASAAGVLTQIGDAPYSVSKAAAVSFAEWLAITYGDRGIQVHCLAPMGVNTNLLNAGLDADSQSVNVVAAAGQILEPEDVAKDVMDAIEANRFMVLPHPEVAEYERRRAADRDRWLAGMSRLWSGLRERGSV
jgi:NAD(P)-dependent dehydrogenase (short-subunit alcohol dehydrogenase family)